MDDLISRQDAIDALEEERCPCESDYDEGYLSMLDKAIWIMREWLPSAQRWIPCSERLPEDCTNVLVWFEYFRYGDYNRLYQMYGIGNYLSEFDSWLINQETGWSKLKAIAWMPLPEPYKGEQE